jgi:hypothetical protein
MDALTQRGSESRTNANVELWRIQAQATAATSSSLSPNQRLPFELIGEIFLHCLNSKRAVFQRLHDLSKEAPSLLCRVRSAWQSVALAIPDLWNRLSLSINLPPTGYDAAIQKYSALVSQRFSRTGLGKASGTLSLTFDLYGTQKAPCQQFLLDVVIPSLIRCRHLHLRLRDTFYVEPLTILNGGNMEQLESLILERGIHSYKTATSYPSLTTCDASPRLRHVSTSFIAFEGTNLKPTYPWEQLTFLNISEPLKVACWADLLPFCTNLK